MGGPPQSQFNTQDQITQQELGIQQQALAGSQEDRASRVALEQPAIDFNKALTSGDPNAVMKAIAPQLTGVSQSRASNKESIYESVGPGAARDVALAQNDINAGNQTASLRANAVSTAFDKLANIGAGLGSTSLQELGAGISSGSAASSSNQVALNAQEQAKASTLGFLGNLAGAGSQLATGYKGCWIAEAIYGVDDVRTHVVRAWLNGPYADTVCGSVVMRLYARFGQRIAAFLNRRPWYKRLFKPIFDMALRRATSGVQVTHA